MAQTTKKAFATSLKKLLSQKPLDKIKITDITEDCEVNRQTFYYHFKDIYDLLEWVYTNEATRALGDKKTYDTWQEGFYEIFEYILENKTFVLNTYNSVSREYLERYLYNFDFKKSKIIKNEYQMKRDYKHLFFIQNRYQTEKQYLSNLFDNY